MEYTGDWFVQNLAKKLKRLQMEKGLTTGMGAYGCGLSLPGYRSILYGHSFVHSETLARMCNFYKVKPSYFLDPEEE